MRAGLALIAVGALARLAHADPPAITPANVEHVETIAIGVPSLVTFTGATLLALSLDGKLHSRIWPVTGLAMMFVGPSLGQLYLHRIQSKGLALRLGGWVVGAIGARMVFHSCAADTGDNQSCNRGAVITAVGAIAVIAGSALEIHSGYAHARDSALSLAFTGSGIGVVGRF